MQDTFQIAIPTATILVSIFAGILFNQRAVDKLENRLEARIDKLDSKIDRVQSDIKYDLTRLETKVDRIQADLSIFQSEQARHDLRIERLEHPGDRTNQG